MSEHPSYPGRNARDIVEDSRRFVEGLQTNIATGKNIFDAKAKALIAATQEIRADLHSTAIVLAEANMPVDTIDHLYSGEFEVQGWFSQSRVKTAPGFSIACPLWWILDATDKDLAGRQLEKASRWSDGERKGVSIPSQRVLQPGTLYESSAVAITPSGNPVSVYRPAKLEMGGSIGSFTTKNLRPFRLEDFINIETISADKILDTVRTMRSRISAATDRYIERMKRDREGSAERREHAWFLTHDEAAWVNQEVPEDVLVKQGLEAWCQNS